MGYAVERYPVPERDVHAAGLVSVTNLIVRRRFGAGPVIALNSHGDVVPPGEGWTRPPYEGVIEDGRMYGRGVAVSKSDFATYAFALRALERVAKASAVPLAGTIELHFTYDEEFGGELGPAWLLANGHTRPDLALGPGILVCDRHRAQRLPAARGQRARPCRACRDAGNRRRCARRGDADPRCAVCAARGLRNAALARRRHRDADDQHRPHRWRHEHERRARKGRVQARPSHDSGGRPGRRRGRAPRGDRARGGAIARHSRRDPPPDARPRAGAEAWSRASGGAAPGATPGV